MSLPGLGVLVADTRLVAIAREVIAAETDTSTGTRSRLIRRVTKAVEDAHGPGVVPLPARTTFYRLIDTLATSTVSLATQAGITVRYLEMIEADSRTPSVPVLRKLAKVLGVRTSAFVGEAPSEDHEGCRDRTGRLPALLGRG